MKCGSLPGSIFYLTNPRDKARRDITTIICLFAQRHKILPGAHLELARWKGQNSALLFMGQARTRQQTLDKLTKV
ncbi:hypothetical protein D0Z70_23925 [Sphingobium terrigena]|uniref:Uncharacterized protein n=2 Tax=Sphingobium terrigena TaxID=2304063 RepID=A0A418YI72_9SPHN|nr:hypothetical protein D0Z70_23925 [Sphingobium terrigena]